MRYGYARTSTQEQKHGLKAQVEALKDEGVAANAIIEEHISGSVAAKRRPALGKLFTLLKEGDTLIVTKLDRLGRNAPDTLGLLQELEKKGVGVRIIELGTDTTGSAGKLILGVLAAVSEWERESLRERTKQGLKEARRAGKCLGRPRALSVEQEREVRRQLHMTEPPTISTLARLFKCSPHTIYRVKWSAKETAAPEDWSLESES